MFLNNSFVNDWFTENYPNFVVMDLLIKNIHQLVGVRTESILLKGASLAELPILNNAYLKIRDGRIAAYGLMSELTNEMTDVVTQTMDASGATILPTWCDSHTHLVFAASRETEFVDKIKGASYEEIAAKGGGILNSAKTLNASSEDHLFENSLVRMNELIKLGTGAIEIKSGYGLTVEGELKMLRVIKRLKAVSPIPIKATFLGAHAFPITYKNDHQGYIDLIIHEMLPRIAEEGLADYIDVFCEQGFFSPSETKMICEAGIKYGMKAKIHANQLYVSGGVEAGVEIGAISVDHLENMDESAISSLAGSNTIGTLLPTAAYFLRMPFPPARILIERGCAIALASDLNPGSSPSGNMNQVVSMACIQMKLLPEEAINAATLNGAFAMELAEEVGSVSIGKRANLIFTKPIPSLAYLPYAFGSNLIDKVMINGQFI